MYRIHQKCVILFILVCVGTVSFYEEGSAALNVELQLYPNKTNITIDSGGPDPKRISLKTLVSKANTNITYQWKLDGPGKLEGLSTEPGIFYLPPEEIDGKSAEATVTVIVSDELKNKGSKRVTFKIVDPQKTGISKKTIIIGAGTAAAVGVGIYFLTSNDGDNNDCKDKEGEYKNDEDYTYLAEYSGKVWIKIVRRCKDLDGVHYYKLHWGPWVCENQLPLGKWKSVTLVFTKDVDIGYPTPLHFHIEPPCLITFGRGEPSDPLDDELVIDLSNDSCWQQT